MEDSRAEARSSGRCCSSTGSRTRPMPTLLPIPGSAAKMLTQAALALALLLALLLNRARLVRANLFLTLVTLGAGAALLTSVRFSSGVGSFAREARLFAFVAVLWLLTPFWGRRDLAVCRWHLQCLAVVCGLVVLGFVVSPGGARQFQGRLGGYVWPIPPTQVGHLSAVMVGIAVVLWMAGSLAREDGALLGSAGFVILLLTQTRTAMLGLVVGLVGAMLCLFVVRRRVRRVVVILLIAVPFALILFAPAASDWFDRGQSSQQIGSLTGRTQVWDRILAEPRPTLDRWLGSGLSNKSFDGTSHRQQLARDLPGRGPHRRPHRRCHPFEPPAHRCAPTPGPRDRGRDLPGALLHDLVDYRDGTRRRLALPARSHRRRVAVGRAHHEPLGAEQMRILQVHNRYRSGSPERRGPRRRPGRRGTSRARPRRRALRARER